MTGDYAKDTISVVKTLQTAVDTPKDSPNKDEVRSEALTLITDYISRYRNRGMVTKTCLLYTSPSPRDKTVSRMPSSA